MEENGSHHNHLVFHAGSACICFEGETQAKSITPGYDSKIVEKMTSCSRHPKIAMMLDTTNVDFPCTTAAGMLPQQVVFSYARKL
jgi:muramidase (phage lysozyme)